MSHAATPGKGRLLPLFIHSVGSAELRAKGHYRTVAHRAESYVLMYPV